MTQLNWNKRIEKKKTDESVERYRAQREMMDKKKEENIFSFSGNITFRFDWVIFVDFSCCFFAEWTVNRKMSESKLEMKQNPRAASVCQSKTGFLMCATTNSEE